MASSPRQLAVEVVRDHTGPGQPMVEREPGGANEISLGHDAGIGPGREPSRRLFDHLLLLGSEADHLGQATVTELRVWTVADGVNDRLDRLPEGRQERGRHVARAWIRIDARPHTPVLLGLV